jgi:MFS family permease
MTNEALPQGAPTGDTTRAPDPPPERLPPLWRNRDYMLLWSGQTISTIGGSMSGIVFPLLILSLTDSPAAAGLAAALFSAPYVIFSLPVGALIDRWDRKKVMILCDLGRALSLASVPIAMAFDVLTIWQLYANAFIEGSLFVFFNIAEVAALPRVVPKVQLPAAAGQNEAAFAAAGLIGPPLGGFLYQSLGRAVPFVADAVSYIISVISLLFIQTNFQEQRVATQRNLRAEIVEGMAWLWRNPLIRFMAFLTGGLNLVNAASFLIVIILAQRLGAGEAAIGVMFSIGAVGGMVGALVGGQIQKRFSFGQVIIGTVVVSALAFPLLALAPNIIMLGVIFGIVYMTGPIYNVVQFSYRLALIPDQLQGRVNSTFRLLAFGFQPLGAALSGLLLEWIGPTPTIAVFSAWYLGLTLLTILNPHIRNARPIQQAQSA